MDDINYTVIAFANTDGGKIYIGMNDDGTPKGIEDIDDNMLRVTNMIRDAIRPDVTIFMDCGVEVIDGKNVVVLTIQRGTSRPYYLHGKGVRPEGVYVRQGASTVPASETAILHMIKETSGDRYEDGRSINQQLTFEKTAAYFKKKKVEFKESQKRTLKLINEDGTYSNLGLLLSDQCVHTIKLAVFEGSSKTIFHDRKELSGSLLEQLEEAYSYIDSFNRTRAEFKGLDRIDMRDYPPEAVREALLNAIVHREYSMNGPALISIFDDRIEFVTIGGLVKGITLDDVKLGVSVLRNEHLANVFYRLRLIEAYGTGILKINECYDDYDVKPRLEATNNAFKITLPNTNFKNSAFKEKKLKRINSVNRREERILGLFEDDEIIYRKDVEDVLNVSQATAINVLRDMVEKEMLIKESGGKYMCYRLNKKKEL